MSIIAQAKSTGSNDRNGETYGGFDLSVKRNGKLHGEMRIVLIELRVAALRLRGFVELNRDHK